MLKEAIAVLLVVAGVAVAGARERDDEPAPVVVRNNASNITLDLAGDLRLESSLDRLSMECASPLAPTRGTGSAHAIQGRTAVARRRAARRADL